MVGPSGRKVASVPANKKGEGVKKEPFNTGPMEYGPNQKAKGTVRDDCFSEASTGTPEDMAVGNPH